MKKRISILRYDSDIVSGSEVATHSWFTLQLLPHHSTVYDLDDLPDFYVRLADKRTAEVVAQPFKIEIDSSKIAGLDVRTMNAMLGRAVYELVDQVSSLQGEKEAYSIEYDVVNTFSLTAAQDAHYNFTLLGGSISKIVMTDRVAKVREGQLYPSLTLAADGYYVLALPLTSKLSLRTITSVDYDHVSMFTAGKYSVGARLVGEDCIAVIERGPMLGGDLVNLSDYYLDQVSLRKTIDTKINEYFPFLTEDWFILGNLFEAREVAPGQSVIPLNVANNLPECFHRRV